MSDAPTLSFRPVTCSDCLAGDIFVRATQAGMERQVINSASGIGNQTLIDAGPMSAIDVKGDVGQATEVCFLQFGRIMFLDAATSPRSLLELSAYRADPWLCAQIDRAVTLVIIPGEPELLEASVNKPERRPVVSQVEYDDSPLVALKDCQVTGRGRLNFRDGPGGEKSGKTLVPKHTTFSAIARTDHWFMVRYENMPGWISADFVRTEGECGDADEAVGAES